jgi:hypothetical protein
MYGPGRCSNTDRGSLLSADTPSALYVRRTRRISGLSREVRAWTIPRLSRDVNRVVAREICSGKGPRSVGWGALERYAREIA